jgi:Fic family protein
MSNDGSGRAYEKSHPWLTFSFDSRKLDWQTWLLLGEAKSKCEHVTGAPLLPETKDMLFGVFLAKGALGTTAIEGNTLTEDEVRRRIDGQLKLPPSKEYLGQEIDNVLAAYNTIGKQLFESESNNLSVNDIKEYNKLVLKDLPLDDDVVPGEIRQYSVGVAGYRGAPAEDCEYLLGRYVHWLNEEFKGPEGQEIIFGVLKAILSHLYFAWIHPFGDGNGRTARLIEFQILLSVGVPAAAAHLMSNHYNETRSEYYRQLDAASKSGGNTMPFIKYAIQGFVDGLKQQIGLIRSQQLYVHLVHYVYEKFRHKDRDGDDRRKKLVLELIESGKEIVPVNQVRYISPKTAEMYARIVSDKTVERDIETLIDMELLKKENKGIRIHWELLQAFLTPAKKTEN